MRIYADITEPARLVHYMGREGVRWGIDVHRTILHKRAGLGASARPRHPLYGAGADYVVTDNAGFPVAAIERKSLDDLAKTITLAEPGKGSKIFRQLRDLVHQPLPILLLEGLPSPLYARIESASIGIQFWCARQGIAVVMTTCPAMSAQAVLLVARKLAVQLEPQLSRSDP